MNFCTECGNKLSGGEKFCSNCGFKLSEDAHPNGAARAAQAEPVNETSSQQKRAEVQPEKNISQPTSTEETRETHTLSVTAPLKAVVFGLLKLAVLALIILLPSYFFYEQDLYTLCTLWSFGGALLVFAWPYRKQWNVNWATTLVPAAAVFFVSDYILTLFVLESQVEIGYLLESAEYFAFGAIICGVLSGLAFGSLRSIERSSSEKGGDQITSRSVFLYLLAWGGAILMVSTLGTLLNWPITLFFMSLLISFSGLAITVFFVVFAIRRYLLPRKWIRTATQAATVCVLLTTLLSHAAVAQGFSEGEKQAFRDKIGPLMLGISEFLKDKSWNHHWDDPRKAGFNKFHFKTTLNDRLLARMTVNVGTQDHNPMQSGESTGIDYGMFQSQQAASAELKKKAEILAAEVRADSKNSDVEIRRLEGFEDAIGVYWKRSLYPNSKMKPSYRFRLLMRVNNWVFYLPQKKGYIEERYIALLQAIRYSMGRLGVRGAGVTVARGESVQPRSNTQVENSKRFDPSKPLPSDIVSGQSTGGYRGMSGQDSSPGEAAFRDYRVSEASGVASLMLLGATALSGLGSSLGALVMSFFGKV